MASLKVGVDFSKLVIIFFQSIHFINCDSLYDLLVSFVYLMLLFRECLAEEEAQSTRRRRD